MEGGAAKNGTRFSRDLSSGQQLAKGRNERTRAAGLRRRKLRPAALKREPFGSKPAERTHSSAAARRADARIFALPAAERRRHRAFGRVAALRPRAAAGCRRLRRRTVLHAKTPDSPPIPRGIADTATGSQPSGGGIEPLGELQPSARGRLRPAALACDFLSRAAGCRPLRGRNETSPESPPPFLILNKERAARLATGGPAPFLRNTARQGAVTPALRGRLARKRGAGLRQGLQAYLFTTYGS